MIKRLWVKGGNLKIQINVWQSFFCLFRLIISLFSFVENNTIIFGLEPFHRIIFVQSMFASQTAWLTLFVPNIHALWKNGKKNQTFLRFFCQVFYFPTYLLKSRVNILFKLKMGKNRTISIELKGKTLDRVPNKIQWLKNSNLNPSLDSTIASWSRTFGLTRLDQVTQVTVLDI